MSPDDVKIEKSWKEALSNEFASDYFASLKTFLVEEKKHFNVFPQGSQIFNAFNLTPLHQVKVVILGQDPYHGANQAHGLCFSVPENVQKPPSLMNILKELKCDIDPNISIKSDLTHWANQGVLLLNAILTVRENQAGSHQKKGWEQFTDAAIRTVSEQCNHVVFLLWGNYAGAKSDLINHQKHCILKAAHPSPLSASRGFFGCKHFSKTNQYLESHNIKPIQWGF